MKKRVIFLAFSLLALIFFACNFTMPTAIEVTGSPSVRFAEKVNMGNMFTDELYDAIKKNGAEGMDIVSCINTKDFTFLIHMELFNEDFNLDDSQPEPPDFPGIELGDLFEDLVNDGTVTLPDEERDLIKHDTPMEIPLSEIGSLLEGFEFSEYKTKLYFSGSSIVDKSIIDIIIEEVEVEETEDGEIIKTPNIIKEETVNEFENKSSNIENWKTTGYNGTSCPSDGKEVEIPITGKDIAVSFRVYLPGGTELELSDFEDGTIKVEIVIWLPFVFKAGDSGAEITFPKNALFSSEDDLFGRDEPGAGNMMADIIESLSLEIVLDDNPFKGSRNYLIVSSKGIEIENNLTDNIFPFIISEETMKKINSPENWPFTPNFTVKFPKGATLRFPREFNVVEFIFKAKINYRKDF